MNGHAFGSPMLMLLPTEHFNLAEPAWPTVACFLLYVLCIFPAGVFLLRAGLARRRLSVRAHRRGFDDGQLARAAVRIGLGHELKDTKSFDAFRRQRRSAGLSNVFLGLFAVVMSTAAVLWIPWGEPARLAITPAEFILDYRWPRPDRRVLVNSITNVDYHTIKGPRRRRTTTELRVTLRDGERLDIKPHGYSGSFATLRAAAAVLAERAGLPLEKTVLDQR
ncbi:MAG TPA: hypothetical protein VGN72_06335 [Tepidisphaeraceae bacterium]|nr:hypothetical protein [Tepidisphaeraceae bacterium]